MQIPQAEMACRVCGWWPPVVQVKHGQTRPASEGWRWRELRAHLENVAEVELADHGRGPHMTLLAVVEAETDG